MRLDIKKILIAADHGGYGLKSDISQYLSNKGIEVIDLGCNSSDSVDYPDYGHKMAEAINVNQAEFGIVICGTGIGISIAANRHQGIRAALCHDVTTAKLTRQHNDANILALGARIIGKNVAFDCVDAFLNTEFEGGRHQTRINKI